MQTFTSDSALLAEYRAKESQRAFGTLVERYQQMVLGTAFRRTGNFETARDVTQRVFSALARKAGLLIGRTSVAGWLHQAAVYESMRAAHAEARVHARNVPMADEAMYSISEPVELPTPERWVALEDAIDSLPAPDREVLVLHYFQDLSYEEMARELGLNEPAVRKRASRALERLSGALRQRGIAGNATMLLVAAVAIQSTLVVPTGLAQASLAAAGAGAGASAFLTLTALLSQVPLKTIATILALASIPVLLLAPERATPIRSVAVTTASETAGTAAPRQASPRDSGVGAAGSDAVPRAVNGPQPSVASGSSNSLPAQGPTVLPAARFVGSQPRVVPRFFARPVAFSQLPPVITIPTARIATETPIKPSAGRENSAVGPTKSMASPIADIDSLPAVNHLAELELRPADAASFFGNLLSELLVLQPPDRTALTTFLNQQFANLNLAGLAGPMPSGVSLSEWRSQRETAITDMVRGATELVPSTAASTGVLKEVLSSADLPVESLVSPVVDNVSAATAAVTEAPSALTTVVETTVKNLVPALTSKLQLVR